MKTGTMPPKELLLELFDYQPDTGFLIWKNTPPNQMHFAGDRAGYVYCRGYRRVHVKKRGYREHRIIWILIHGDIPDGMHLDHINGIRDDNRISNLRLVTNAENHKNLNKSKANKSGYTGVVWSRARGKWLASVKENRKSKHLGLFDSKEDAGRVAMEARKALGYSIKSYEATRHD